MSDRKPQFRVSADRQSASRRVRYVETIKPEYGQCTICELDELADLEAMRAAREGRAESPASCSTTAASEPAPNPKA